MLVEINKLQISNTGHRRDISVRKVYVNLDNIISIDNYNGVHPFLINENSEYAQNNFSLIKMNIGNGTEDIIAVGTSEEIFSSFNKKTLEKRLLSE
tara:strand:- start:614 stop:901 length:288 start_codon:yes stop_codon:yes gene_type:complete